MPNFVAWLTADDAEDGTRVADTARTIADKPTTITVQRGSAILDPQVVRVDSEESTPRLTVDPNAATSVLRVVVVGYKGHPEVADTDLRAGDRFYYDRVMYRVVQVLPNTRYRLVAIAESSEDV